MTQMARTVDYAIIGQGLAGTTLAWALHRQGRRLAIVDADESSTASKVAAGLVTPRTGRRMTQREEFTEEWNAALKFYRWVEQTLGISLFEEGTAIRLFSSEQDEQREGREAEAAVSEPWSGRLQGGGIQYSGCRLRPAGRLNVGKYLRSSSAYFRKHQRVERQRLDLPGDLLVEPEVVMIPKLGVSADRVIFCQGVGRNPWFEGIPGNPARGEMLNVSLEDYRLDEVVHQSVWLAPEKDGSITVGATYHWRPETAEPTDGGKKELQKSLRRLIRGRVQVNAHRAGIRPTSADYQPVIGEHREHRRLLVFNGLGSHGVLIAPRIAELLVEYLNGERAALPQRYDVARLLSRPTQKPLTTIAQDRIRDRNIRGGTAVDATVGKGFDTAFLAEQTGPGGKVYGFDIQRRAIEATGKRLKSNGQKNVQLITGSHTDIAKHVDEPISAAMFNLGYLPGGDHSIVTRPEATVEALTQARSLLQPGGVLTALVYRGHAGGPEEASAVENWIKQQTDCSVERIDSQPVRPKAPVLYVVTAWTQKNREIDASGRHDGGR